MTYTPRRSDLLAAIDRRLWRDLGFADPEPTILPFLPMLVVAWADGTVGTAEAETIRERARQLPAPLREWVADRLKFPPGPYFRYQVAHLMSFMVCVWHREERGKSKNWAEAGQEWADDLIQEAGWLRRVLGGMSAEIRDLEALRRVMDEGHIPTSDRLWALARGAHAEAEPHRAVAVISENEQIAQAVGILLEKPDERHALGSFVTIVRDDDLDEDRVRNLLARSQHLREPERWILLAQEVNARGRALTRRQLDELRSRFAVAIGGRFEECEFAELAYLEDALAVDARWMSWVPGKIEELRIDRDAVVRTQAPGTFNVPRAKVHANVAQQLVSGPPGLGFRVLNIEGEGATLRLASPVILTEPATRETVAWIARFLPEMCDPHTQLVLDEDGPRWVAEVHPQLPCRPATTPEPLLPGRSLLVPPWVWFRAAGALGVRFFAGKRKVAANQAPPGPILAAP
ncbi:MAG: hypothetical protein V4850_27580 [Myxococcota bacterium]